jgi:hypothetical protein
MVVTAVTGRGPYRCFPIAGSRRRGRSAYCNQPPLPSSRQPWATLAAVDLNAIGYVIVDTFLLTWLGSVAYLLAKLEQRYAAPLASDVAVSNIASTHDVKEKPSTRDARLDSASTAQEGCNGR